MEIKISLLDKIIVALFYIFLASGVISILINVMIKFEHGEAWASVLLLVFIYLWSRARDITNIKRDKKFQERHERYCNSCTYKKENERK